MPSFAYTNSITKKVTQVLYFPYLGGSPRRDANRGNITPVWLFWLYCFFFLDPAWTVALIVTQNGSNDVFPPKDSPFGVLGDGWRHMGKIFPKNSPKMGVNRQFQAKMPKSLHRTSGLRSEFSPRKALRGWSAIAPKQTHGWRPPSWKSIWRRISAADVPIWTKFGSRMQNDTPITAKWSRSKPEVEFQYDGRLYFEIGSSYISAANWDIWTKFGLQIDHDLLKAVTSRNRKPEVVFSGRGRHLEKWIWRHISALGAPIWTKFDSLIQNNMQITANWSRLKPEVEFQNMADVYISKPKVVISQPPI